MAYISLFASVSNSGRCPEPNKLLSRRGIWVMKWLKNEISRKSVIMSSCGRSLIACSYHSLSIQIAIIMGVMWQHDTTDFTINAVSLSPSLARARAETPRCLHAKRTSAFEWPLMSFASEPAIISWRKREGIIRDNRSFRRSNGNWLSRRLQLYIWLIPEFPIDAGCRNWC